MIFFSKKCDFFAWLNLMNTPVAAFASSGAVQSHRQSARPFSLMLFYLILPDVLMLSCGVGQGVLFPLSKDVPLPCVMGAADSHSGHFAEMATMTVIRKGRGKAM